MPLKMYKEPGQQIKNILAVAAGKGGVGKSTVAVNLARSLKERGLQVGLLDADIYGPSMRRMLPEDRLPQQKGSTIIPAWCEGMRMLSMAYFRAEGDASAVRAPIAIGIITQFLKQVEWGDLDWLIVDFPPGTGDIQLTLAQQAKFLGALMVTTPQEVALMDVKKAMHLFKQVNVPVLGIVENMSYYLLPTTQEKVYPFGQGGGAKLARETGYPLLGEIPLHSELSQSCDNGSSIFSMKGKEVEVLQQVFKELVEKLIHPPSSSYIQPNKVYLKNPTTLTIEWSDGSSKEYSLSSLQKKCPCAFCVDENTGARKERLVDVHVGAKEISSVGRYALKIQFTSGCSTGLYGFDFLHSL